MEKLSLRGTKDDDPVSIRDMTERVLMEIRGRVQKWRDSQDVACVKCEPTCVHGQIQVSFENEIGKVDAQFKRWLSPPGWKGSVVGVIDRD